MDMCVISYPNHVSRPHSENDLSVLQLSMLADNPVNVRSGQMPSRKIQSCQPYFSLSLLMSTTWPARKHLEKLRFKRLLVRLGPSYDSFSSSDLTNFEICAEIFAEALAPGGVTSNVPVVLVLNRIDMLAKKLQEDDCESFKEAFPRFKHDDDREDLEIALDILKDAYLDKTSANSKQSIYVQKTCALDGDNIKTMFNTVRANLQRFRA
jgi:hypothetical protein